MGRDTAGARIRRRRVDASGLTFECLYAGDGDRLALCLHGFPDNAGSMNPVLWRLADAGFTAVPPGFDALLVEHRIQALRSWYMWLFQLPDVPERAFRWRNFAFIDFLWGLWSPEWDYPDARINDVKETFRAEGTLENALQYYRDNVKLPVPVVGEEAPSLEDVPTVRTPMLALYGARDGCISPELFDGSEDVIEQCRLVRVPGAGHFLHQERPDVVGEEIATYLQSSADENRG